VLCPRFCCYSLCFVPCFSNHYVNPFLLIVHVVAASFCLGQPLDQSRATFRIMGLRHRLNPQVDFPSSPILTRRHSSMQFRGSSTRRRAWRILLSKRPWRRCAGWVQRWSGCKTIPGTCFECCGSVDCAWTQSSIQVKRCGDSGWHFDARRRRACQRPPHHPSFARYRNHATPSHPARICPQSIYMQVAKVFDDILVARLPVIWPTPTNSMHTSDAVSSRSRPSRLSPTQLRPMADTATGVETPPDGIGNAAPDSPVLWTRLRRGGAILFSRCWRALPSPSDRDPGLATHLLPWAAASRAHTRAGTRLQPFDWSPCHLVCYRAKVFEPRQDCQSLTLVCDSVSSLSPEHLRLCITTLAQSGWQLDTNIALTAAASLLWSISDAIQAKRK